MADEGRPTDYCPEIVNKTREYLNLCEDSGKYPNLEVRLPSIAGLAVYLKVARSTVYLWRDDHAEFSDILNELLATQEDRLLNNGLSGKYNSTISKLILTKHGYADKVESDLTSNGKDISIPPITWVDTKPDETQQ